MQILIGNDEDCGLIRKTRSATCKQAFLYQAFKQKSGSLSLLFNDTLALIA